MDILAHEPFGSVSSIRSLQSAAPTNRTAPVSTGLSNTISIVKNRIGGEPGNPLPCQ
ncbi:hypothetical protein [Methanoregula sp.]|uniref:hypothetical protein n=1 Tax=Methanoregula sp. TaxID=2052170 RepID=UPI0025E9762C|nr:hypothetical protein [Methanoregula sp.]